MALVDRLIENLEAARQRVRSAVAAVNRTTERETIAAGERLRRIVAMGSEHIAHMKELLGTKLGRSDQGLLAAITQQRQQVGQFLDQVTARLGHHSMQVGATAARVADITDTARQIATLNSEARILALNARIEAARAGEHGRGFAVLAGEMNRLSQAIAQASMRIQGIGKELTHNLPELSQESEALEVMARSFNETAREHAEALAAQVRGLEEDVHVALRESDRVLAGVLDDSHQALSHLQFQDVCAQQLLVTDGWLAEATREAGAALGAHVEIAPAAYATLGASERSEAPAADSPAAGEVTLF